MENIYAKFPSGMCLYDEPHIEKIWAQLDKTPNEFLVAAQKGGQANMLESEADISIVGGQRGGGKSGALLMNALYDIENPHFRALIFRKQIDDLSDLADTSSMFYNQYGTYNRAKNDMTWNFYEGGWLKFTFFDMAEADFHDRYQGKQYAYIGIDEVTQIPFTKFKVLTMSNRNAYGIRNRIMGTCNPDPDSWVRKFIDWWIGEDGLPIPERDGRIRYCYMPTDFTTDIVWGDTREEVYEKCRADIEAHWKPSWNRFGEPAELMIRSVSFVTAKLEDNIALMNSDPSYIGTLFNQDEETKARFLDGNWNYKAAGDDLIKQQHIEQFFNNPKQLADGRKRVSCDAALDGGDKCVFWLWVGNHIQDLYVCGNNSRETLNITRSLLERWGVRQEDFTYDKGGLGKYLEGFFPRAVPFDGKTAVDSRYKGVFYNLNAQSAQYFADHIRDGEYSINSDLLEKRFSGKGYKNKTLRELLNEERRCIRFREEDQTRLIDKGTTMKKLIHRSPDFIDGLRMREIFNIKTVRHRPRNIGIL